MRILPKLDGTFVVPAERHLVAADLQAQTIVQIPAGAGGAGSTFMGNGTLQPDLAWGIAPETGSFEGNTRVARSLQFQQLPAGAASDLNTDVNNGSSLFIPHAGVVRAAFTSTLFENRLCPTATPCNSPRDIRYFTFARFDSAGAFGASTVRMQLTGVPDHVDTALPRTLSSLDIGAPDQPAGHPVARVTDHIAALDRNTGADSDIHTIQFPAEATTTPAPAPITTTADERMPAWSPDGLQLAFVRTVNGRRKLGVYDLTPGIQTITNALVDLGPEAPTPQTSTFQNVWGGLSLAKLPAAPAVTCDARCIAGLRDVGVLAPIVTGVGTKIGIFVVRRTGGTHKVLGVKQPTIKVVGKFPLGKAKKGRNRLGNLSKRLKPGSTSPPTACYAARR
jgi:hypothetical protein